MTTSDAMLLRIYLDEGDRSEGHPLYERIVQHARDLELGGQRFCAAHSVTAPAVCIRPGFFNSATTCRWSSKLSRVAPTSIAC